VFGPPALGLAAHWGAAGLTLAAGVCGWIEFALLRRALNRRIGPSGLPLRAVATLWIAAGGAALAGWGVKLAFAGAGHPLLRGAAVLAAYGLAYFGLAALLRVPELGSLLRRIPYLRRYAPRYNGDSSGPSADAGRG
jgi:putative peptidoglycan lipid II flippase